MTEHDELVKEHNLEDLSVKLQFVIATAHYLLSGVEVKFSEVINDINNMTHLVSYKLSSPEELEKKWIIPKEQYEKYTIGNLNEKISDTVAKELTLGMFMESNSLEYNPFEKINYSILLDNFLRQNVFSEIHNEFDSIKKGIQFFYHNSGDLINDYKIFHLINNGKYRVAENKYESLWLAWANQIFLYGKRVKHDVEVSELLFEADYYMEKKDYKKMNESLAVIKELSPDFDAMNFFKVKER